MENPPVAVRISPKLMGDKITTTDNALWVSSGIHNPLPRRVSHRPFHKETGHSGGRDALRL